MSNINIPAGNIIMPSQAFSSEHVEHILGELCAPGHEFSGYTKVISGDSIYLLFFFNCCPYAAARVTNHIHTKMSLKEYFSTLVSFESKKASISIHALDPVLLKSLLIFFQNTPTIKAPSHLLNLKTTLDQIRLESADAMIVLQKQQHMNLFFFKFNTPGAAYYADSKFKHDANSTVEEQMLAYASQPNSKITASIFRNMVTTQDNQAQSINPVEIISTTRGVNSQEEYGDNLVLKVMGGPQKGEVLRGSIPCVMGRKDTDIVVNDALVSKRHAVLKQVDNKLLLMDMNSTNGTFINGKRIKQHEIALGDIIMLGETTMIVEKLYAPS